MKENALSTAEDHATVPLHASRSAGIDLARTVEELTDLAWLGPRIDGPPERADLRRVNADLELRILDGSATGPIRKAALIDIGAPRVVGDAVLAEVGWRSASLAPLFPVFAGQLRITARSLELDGRYMPPFGTLGLLIDAGILHLVARRTAQAFLTRLAARFEGGA